MTDEIKYSTSTCAIVFVDGASSGNPGPGGWGTIIALPGGEVMELGGREVPTTNNRMELSAIIHGLKYLEKFSNPIKVYSDSSYVIRGITQWVWGWKKKGWITAEGKEVANTDLWKLLFSLTHQKKIEWHYVRGHSGIPGNERADQIAVAFSQNFPIQLYRGAYSQYPIRLEQIPSDTRLPRFSIISVQFFEKALFLSQLGRS